MTQTPCPSARWTEHGTVFSCVFFEDHDGAHTDAEGHRWSDGHPVSLPSLVTRRMRHRAAAARSMEHYRRDAKVNQRINDAAQVVVIIGSFTVTALTGIGTQQGSARWATVIVSAIVGSVSGGMAYFKFRARSHNSQQTADAIERELFTSWLGIDDYAEQDDEAASGLLAQRVEVIRETHQQRARELEQSPPEARGDPSPETSPNSRRGHRGSRRPEKE